MGCLPSLFRLLQERGVPAAIDDSDLRVLQQSLGLEAVPLAALALAVRRRNRRAGQGTRICVRMTWTWYGS